MTLAELVIKLSADTAALRTDFDKASKMARDTASAIKDAFAALGAGITVGGFGEMVKSVADLGEELSRAAAKTGMTTEQISGLKFAAESTGTGFDVLQKGLTIFDRNLSGLANTNSQAAKAIEALGISTRGADGNIRPAHELLLSVAERFQGMRDGAEKTAVAMALFGRSGAELIPFLDRGAAGIAELEGQAKQLGVTLGDSSARGLTSFHEQLTALSAEFDGLKIKLVSAFFPSLSQLAGMALGDANAIRALKDETQMYAVALKAVAYDLSYPARIFTSPAENKAQLQAYAKQMTDLATDEHAALQAMRDGMSGAAFPHLGEGVFNIPLVGGGRKKQSKGTGGDDDTYQYAPDEDGKDKLEAYYKTLIDFTHGLMMAQDPLAQYAGQMSKLNDALKIGLVTTQEYKDLSTALGNDFMGKGLAVLPLSSAGNDRGAAPQFKLMSDSFKSLRDNAKQFGAEMSSSFTQMIVYGRGFTSMLQSMVDLLAEFILKTYVFKELSSEFSMLGGKGGGTLGSILGVLGSMFGGLAGGRASGGPVMADSLYMVGENGPELFAPGTSGSIIPSSGFGGGGGSTVNIDARGAQPGVEHLIIRAMQTMQKQMGAQALATAYEYHARGGTL